MPEIPFKAKCGALAWNMHNILAKLEAIGDFKDVSLTTDDRAILYTIAQFASEIEEHSRKNK